MSEDQVTNTQRAAMQQTLKALVQADSRDGMYSYADEIAALSQALAEPVVEPVAFLHDDGYWTAAKTHAGRALNDKLHFAGSTKVAVFTSPPPAEVPLLTDEEAYAIYAQVMQSLLTSIKAKHYWEAAPGLARQFAREIEQAVRQKVGIK